GRRAGAPPLVPRREHRGELGPLRLHVGLDDLVELDAPVVLELFGDLLVDLAVLPDHEGEPLRVSRRALSPRSGLGEERSGGEEAGRGRSLHEPAPRQRKTDRSRCAHDSPPTMRSTTRARARDGIDRWPRRRWPENRRGPEMWQDGFTWARPGNRRSSPPPAKKARGPPPPADPARPPPLARTPRSGPP